MCASLCDFYNKRISFEKKHDFLFENIRAEVKRAVTNSNAWIGTNGKRKNNIIQCKFMLYENRSAKKPNINEVGC